MCYALSKMKKYRAQIGPHTQGYYDEDTWQFVRPRERPLFPKKPLRKRIGYFFAFTYIDIDSSIPKDATGRYTGKEHINWRKTAFAVCVIVGFIVLGYFWMS